MIVKGKSRSGPSALAAHLGNAEKNERVSLIETRGTVAQDLRGALVEMDALAVGTRCEKPLYHAAMSPEPPHRLTAEQRAEAVDALEKKLGLDGHARVVVMHEKLGRGHIHVVWSRIDAGKMRSVSDSHNYRKHEEVARDLERRFGHERVQGAHAERGGAERPERTPSRAELRQEERTGIKGKDVRREITEAFRASDGPEAFRAALEDRGYLLAKGDRRDFVVVDRAGGIHSLARRIEGIKAAELKEFMAGIDRERLPDIVSAKKQIEERFGRIRDSNAKIGKAYGRGEDYVSQSSAALKDHKRNIEKKRSIYERMQSDDRAEEARRSSNASSHGEKKPEAEMRPGKSIYERMERDGVAPEMTEARQRKAGKLLAGERADEKPDRQPEAPGGGRARSR